MRQAALLFLFVFIFISNPLAAAGKPSTTWSYLDIEHVFGEVRHFHSASQSEDRDTQRVEAAVQVHRRAFFYVGQRSAYLNFTDRDLSTLLPASSFLTGTQLKSAVNVQVKSTIDVHAEDRDTFIGVGGSFRVGQRKAVDLSLLAGFLKQRHRTRQAGRIIFPSPVSTGRAQILSVDRLRSNHRQGYFLTLGARRYLGIGELYAETSYEHALDDGNLLAEIGVRFKLGKGLQLGLSYQFDHDFEQRIPVTVFDRKDEYKGFGISTRYAFKR